MRMALMYGINEFSVLYKNGECQRVMIGSVFFCDCITVVKFSESYLKNYRIDSLINTYQTNEESLSEEVDHTVESSTYKLIILELSGKFVL